VGRVRKTFNTNHKIIELHDSSVEIKKSENPGSNPRRKTMLTQALNVIQPAFRESINETRN
jgi:hypothetical protein